MNTVGGALYSYVKYKEGERKKRQMEAEKHPSMVSLLSNTDQEGTSIVANGGYRRHRGSLTSNEDQINTENNSEGGLWMNNNDASIKYVDERK